MNPATSSLGNLSIVTVECLFVKYFYTLLLFFPVLSPVEVYNFPFGGFYRPNALQFPP